MGILSFVGFIAGIAGAAMGILFIVAYKKYNPEDKSKFSTIAACILIPIEIVIAELLTIFILAGIYEVSFAAALANKEIQGIILLDIIIGLVLSFAVFAGYLFNLKRKDQLENRRVRTDNNNDNKF